MNYVEQKEIEAIIASVADAAFASAPAKQGVDGSPLRRAVGVLRASSAAVSDPLTFARLLLDALNAARDAGATYRTMAGVRLAAIAEAPTTVIAVAVAQAAVRLSLAQEARLASSIEFRSRDDANQVATDMNAAFQTAAEVASDEMDAGSYMAIIALQASVVKLFADRARLLPRVVYFEFATTMPALKMSQRIYAVGSRSDELRDENHVVHPAFMPRRVRGLAV